MAHFANPRLANLKSGITIAKNARYQLLYKLNALLMLLELFYTFCHNHELMS